MKLSNTITPVTFQLRDASLISHIDYLAMDAFGSSLPYSIIRFINGTTLDVFVSIDQINNCIMIPALHTVQIDFQRNNPNTNLMSYLAKETIFYIITDVMPLKPLGVFAIAGYSSYTTKE